MEQFPLLPMDMPATYRICVVGDIDNDYAERYWGMKLSPIEQTGEPEQIALVGEVADQAALVGIINALYNAGHTVVSVERMLPDTNLPKDNTKEEA
ncbi:MAG: hypothetical protein JSV68_07690 [Anaerolineaceae bacterium]|nr:MAG: hypothetical protein JSV68_07690 [Anaerolineaceae bacterium]